MEVRKFVDLCDAFHIPLLSLMDCPGFLVGPKIESQRMVSLKGRLLNSMFGASVPLVTVVLRKAIGLAYIALGGRAVDPDLLVAWPTARDEIKKRIEDESSAYAAAGMGLTDDVITPAETRARIFEAFDRSRGSQNYFWKHRIDP